MTQAGPDPATRADTHGGLAALDAMDVRLSAIHERWQQRSQAMEQRLRVTFERGLREAITSQTCALVGSLVMSVVAIAGLAFRVAD